VKVERERGRCGLLRAELKVEARDKHGRLIATRVKQADLILDNFKDLLAAILIPEYEWADGTMTFAKYASLVDLAGTSYSVAAHGGDKIETGYNISINFTGIGSYGTLSAGRMGVRIRVGTSTVAPARGDYKLGAEVANGIPTQTVGADYVSWAVSITLAAAADIAEAGLSMRCNRAATGAGMAFSDFLFFRDTFTPISVPAGGTISVTYKLTV